MCFKFIPCNYPLCVLYRQYRYISSILLLLAVCEWMCIAFFVLIYVCLFFFLFQLYLKETTVINQFNVFRNIKNSIFMNDHGLLLHEQSLRLHVYVWRESSIAQLIFVDISWHTQNVNKTKIESQNAYNSHKFYYDFCFELENASSVAASLRAATKTHK